MLFDIISVVLRTLFVFALVYSLFVCVWLWKYIEAFAYALYTKDNKWKSLPDPDQAWTRAAQEESRRVVFIRHGESTWNDTFNRTKIPVFFIPRLIKAALYEIFFLASRMRESWFYDSPLSHTGVQQAVELRDFLSKPVPTSVDEVVVQQLLGKGGKSTVVCSNLRRAISTCLIGLWDRLQHADGKVLLMTHLQEISRNPDTLSITEALTCPEASWVDRTFKDITMVDAYRSKLDPAMHEGNKGVDSNGLQRMLQFNQWSFSQDHGTIIAVGHSLWFRSYFKEFLPRSTDHPAKAKKIVNAGVISFVVQRRVTADATPIYRINPDSIQTVFGGFGK